MVDSEHVRFGTIGASPSQAVRVRDLSAVHIGRHAVLEIGDHYRCSGVIVEILHQENSVEVAQRKSNGHEWTARISDLDLEVVLAD